MTIIQVVMIIIMAAFIYLNREQGKLSTAANCEVYLFLLFYFLRHKRRQNNFKYKEKAMKKTNNESSKSKTNTWM